MMSGPPTATSQARFFIPSRQNVVRQLRTIQASFTPRQFHCKRESSRSLENKGNIRFRLTAIFALQVVKPAISVKHVILLSSTRRSSYWVQNWNGFENDETEEMSFDDVVWIVASWVVGLSAGQSYYDPRLLDR